MHRLLAVALGSTVLFGPGTAHALPITYNFSGVITFVGIVPSCLLW